MLHTQLQGKEEGWAGEVTKVIIDVYRLNDQSRPASTVNHHAPVQQLGGASSQQPSWQAASSSGQQQLPLQRRRYTSPQLLDLLQGAGISMPAVAGECTKQVQI